MQGDLKIFQSRFLNFSTSQTECLGVLGFCKGVYLEPLEVVVEKRNPQCNGLFCYWVVCVSNKNV
jgi:hypothetical protein